jgi:trimethylamine--corrinoid protein Co-methyltransferase
MNVLSETGVAVHSQKALELLRDGGAEILWDRKVARIPRKLVEECLSSVPSQFPIYNMDRKIAFVIGERPCRHCTGFDELSIPLDSGAWRDMKKADIGEFTAIADALDNVDMVGPQGLAHDVMPQSAILHGADAVFRHTNKPFYFAVDRLQVLRAVCDLTRIVIDENNLAKCPPMIVQISPSSPLFWTEGAAESLMEAARCGVPITCLPQPMAGASAPLTLAGELIVGNAEFLSCCVITQLAKKGSPLIYGAAWTVIHMHESNALFATPEAQLLRVAGIQMAHSYGVPAHVQGLNADAPVYDEQLGWEKTLTGMCGILGDADLIVGGGAYGTAMVSSKEQLVLDNEVLGILRRLKRGIAVSDESMAFKTIQEVGPQGNYLLEDHTLRHLRSEEHFISRVSNKSGYQRWKGKGFPSVLDNARLQAREILEDHAPRKLSEDAQKRMSQLIQRFESEIGKLGSA